MKTRSSAKPANRPNNVDPHPDFADVDLPRDVTIGAFHLTPLSPDFVDEDMAAVLDTGSLMDGIFGDWPAGLTREDNAIDLAWHEREFTVRRSFSWILRDAADTYIGCVYLFPELGCRGKANVKIWLCNIPDRATVAADLKAELGGWFTKVLPPGIALTWITRPVI